MALDVHAQMQKVPSTRKRKYSHTHVSNARVRAGTCKYSRLNSKKSS